MPTTARTIRLFVSSTFSDMKAERNVLQRDVFPKLQRHCLANGLRFQAIDLRWGVSEEAGRDNRTMRICLRELKRCQEPGRPRPNFLILLGNRYGWRPLPELVPADLFEALEKKLFPSEAERLREWYRRDDNAVPPVYELQPRGEEVTGWHETVEKRLLGFLEKAKEALRSDPVLTGELRGTLDAAAIGISATEQEIRAGALTVEDARHHVHAFYRTITGPPPDQLPGDYVDLADGHPDSLAAEALRNLKDRIKETIGENVRPYDVPWRGNDVSEADLSQFTSDVYDRLKAVIDVQIGSLKEIPPEEQEEDAHRTFGEERRAGFIGRDEPLKLIADYLHDGPAQILAAVGPAGSGKSAVMAEAVHRARLMANDDGVVLARFLGVTPGSSDLIQTLRDIVGRIRNRYPRENVEELQSGSGPEPSEPGEKKADDREIPSDINPLTNAFHEALARATPGRPLWLFLDALDQLRDTELAATLSWLPDKLPGGVRVVVSSALPADGKSEAEGPSSKTSPSDPRERILRNLERLAPGTQTVRLKPLTTEDGSALLEQWLATAGRKLQQAQREPILRSFVVEGNALWLRVAAEEATRQASWSAPESLPFSLPALLETVLMRLSRNEEHGEILVKRALGYLASARHGLAEDEVVGILGIDPVVMEDVIARAPTERAKPPEERIKTLPLAVWVRLHGDIAYYLTERQNQGSALLGFYHRTFGEAVECFCLADASARLAIHNTTAQWFAKQVWFLPPVSEEKTTEAKPDRDNPPNTRKASELPWHLHRVAEWSEPQDCWDALVTILCDLDCVEVAARSRLIYELVGDYNAALVALPEFREEIKRNRLRDAAMSRYNSALREYSVARYEWFKAKVRGQTSLEPPYPPLPPELRDDGARQIPEETSKRAARLRHFSNFVSAHISPLNETPGDTLPLAFNDAEEGPVLAEAQQRVGACTAAWLRRSPRPPAPAFRPQCLRTLEGHSDFVESVSVSPDGRCAVSGSRDNTLRVWDLDTGRCLRTLEDQSSLVTSVSLSPDGRRAVSCNWDGTLLVWDLERAQCLRTLEGHSNRVDCVRVSPDGLYAVSCSWDGTLRVWDLETGQCLRTLEDQSSLVTSVSLSPDGLHAVSGGVDSTLRVWDLETGQCLRTLRGHSSLVTCVRVSPDGRRAISGSRDKTLRVWDLGTGQFLTNLEACSSPFTSLSPYANRAVSGSYDKTLRIWDLNTGQCLRTLRGHSSLVKSVSVSPDGRRVVSGSYDKTLRVWDPETGQCLYTLAEHGEVVTSVSVSPDGRCAVSGSKDSTLRVWDLETGQCLRALEGHSSLVTSVSVIPDGRRAVSCSWDGTLRVWDLESGQCLRTLEGHRNEVESMSLSPDGRRAVSGSRDKTLRVWDLETGACLCTLEGHSDWVDSVSVIPDGRHAVSGSHDHTLRVWDLTTGQCLYTLKGHSAQVTCVNVSPDGRRAVSGSGNFFAGNDNTLRVWDLETGACLVEYCTDSPSSCAAFSPCFDRIICGFEDGQMHFLTPVNLPTAGPIIVTVLPQRQRKWFRTKVCISTRCPCCAGGFEPSAKVLAAILPSSEFPYPPQAFADPRLLTTCPHCAKPLKFNPFFAGSF